MNSKIILVKNIHLDRQYTNVLDYTEAQMLELCTQNMIAQANDYSFIRTSRTIMTNFKYSDALKANYIAFQNPDYSNKWFFAWIDDVIYKGNYNTEISYTIDSWSTWFDYWKPKTCLINRQHVNDDTIGSNTLNENLAVENVVQEGQVEDISYIDYWIAIQTAWIPEGSDGGEQYSGISVYNKQVFGTKICLFKAQNLSDYLNVSLFILRTNSDKHIEDIENMFIVPSTLINESELTKHDCTISNSSFTFYTMPYNNDIISFDTTIQKITSYNDYTPKNNKCFCYPYNYLLVTNNIGSQNIFKYEDFYGQNEIKFKNEAVISIGASGKITPLNYKKMERCDDESLSLGKFPTCAWSSDAFLNWISQNSVNEAISLAGGIFGIANQAAESSAQKNSNYNQIGVNIGVNTAMQLANSIGKFYSATLLPNIRGGQNTGDVTWATGRTLYTFRQMRIKTENLKVIDDYFTRFGYKIDKIEMPNIKGRKYWNYVEIGSAEEIGYGEVPSRFMDIINNACRRGVTIWHNHSDIGNFNLVNSIIKREEISSLFINLV